MALFDIFRSSSYSHVIVTMGISCMVFPPRESETLVEKRHTPFYLAIPR